MGVALTNVVTRRPSGTESTISSARTVVAVLSASGRGRCCHGDLPPVGTPPGQDLEQLLRGAARQAQPADDPLRLPVERDRMAGPGIEDHDAHR